MSDTSPLVKRRGLSKTHATIDYNIWQWKTSVEKAKNGQRVCKTQVQKYALQAYKEAGIDSFKASDGWYRRWRMRWQRFDSNETNVLDRIQGPAEDNQVILSDKKPVVKKSTRINILRSNKKKATLIHSKIHSPVSTYTSNNYLNSKLDSDLMDIDSECVVRTDTNKKGSNDVVPNCIGNDCLNQKKPTFASGNDDLGLLNEISVTDKVDHCAAATNSCSQDVDEPNSYLLDHVGTATSQVKPASVDESISVNISQPSPVAARSHDETQCKEAEDIAQTTSNSSFSKASLNLNEDELDLEDHDLFCHSCEDFHPKAERLGKKCEKPNNNTLLSCVLEKKDTTSTVIPTKKSVDSSLSQNDFNGPQVSEPILNNASTVKPKGKRYLIQFKNEVVNYALENNLKKAAEKFKVNRGTVSDWLGESKRLKDSFPGTMKKISTSCDADFLKWLEDSKFNLTNELLKQQTAEWLSSSGNNKRTSCVWLRMYAHRLNGSEDVSIKKRYIAYPPAFKRVVVFFAETHSNIMASRVFNVARRRILEWQRNGVEGKHLAKDQLPSNLSDKTVDKKVFEWFSVQKVPPNNSQVRKKALELYRKAGNLKIECKAQWYYRWRARHKLPPASKQGMPDCEEVLLIWVLTQLDMNKSVTHTALTAQATELGYPPVARGWSFRFCKKYEQLLATTPDPSTPLPEGLEKQAQYCRYVVRKIINNRNLTPSQIVAMDEVPIQFLPKDVRKRTGLVRRTGFESCQATLIVSCLADGTFLPTLFVFKGTLPTCDANDDVISCTTETGHINDEIMDHWLNKVLFKHLDGLGIGGLLISDCYELHSTETVLAALQKHSVSPGCVPGGCAFKLLPNLHISLMFKSMLDEMCQLSLSNQTETIRPPTADQLYQWVTQIHRHLAKDQKENVKTAFNQKLLS